MKKIIIPSSYDDGTIGHDIGERSQVTIGGIDLLLVCIGYYLASEIHEHDSGYFYVFFIAPWLNGDSSWHGPFKTREEAERFIRLSREDETYLDFLSSSQKALDEEELYKAQELSLLMDELEELEPVIDISEHPDFFENYLDE